MPVGYYTASLIVLSCGECNIPFAIPTNMQTHLERTGELFWCPNGHHIRYHDNENARLRRQVEQEQRRVVQERARADQAAAEAAHEKRRAAAARGQLTKTKKRIGKGVCPCCNRHFVNVERHMESKHPEYAQQP